MRAILNKCPICGSRLTYSVLMQYSLDYQIKSNGELSKKCRKQDVGSMEYGFIYCESPDRDFKTD